ncbi:MAG: presqualene diphosphate synthase HpnD [Alphaproteobacteria bacterium]
MAVEGGITAMDRAAARDHARAVVARSGTSFGLGMRILSRARREAMFAVYAFCREIDDIADEGGTEEKKLAALAGWREEIARLYAGQPEKPTAIALSEHIRAFDLPEKEFLLLIEGMEMDARGPIRAPDRDTLGAYCRRVAGAVGMISIRIFGDASPAAERFALALGDALQLTNILRDVTDDARVGRLYLPREFLEAHGIRSRDPEKVAADPAVGAVCADLAAEARSCFEEARRALAGLDWRIMRPALIMMGMYEGLLERMEARGWSGPLEPVRLSKPEKIFRALRYGLVPPLRVTG